MNILSKIVPFKMRRGLAALGAAGALAACTYNELQPIPEPQPVPEPTLDIVEIVFNVDNISIVSEDAIKKIINGKEGPTIRTIYLVAEEGQWSGMLPNNIQVMRNKFLEPALNVSPKVRGKGTFDFLPGRASKVPEDSLWLVNNGWKIVPYPYVVKSR